VVQVCIDRRQPQQGGKAIVAENICTGLFECPLKFTECVKEVVTKSLLRRFEDPSEKCRLLAISTIKAYVRITTQAHNRRERVLPSRD
jgi:hypothetical protein